MHYFLDLAANRHEITITLGRARRMAQLGVIDLLDPADDAKDLAELHTDTDRMWGLIYYLLFDLLPGDFNLTLVDPDSEPFQQLADEIKEKIVRVRALEDVMDGAVMIEAEAALLDELVFFIHSRKPEIAAVWKMMTRKVKTMRQRAIAKMEKAIDTNTTVEQAADQAIDIAIRQMRSELAETLGPTSSPSPAPPASATGSDTPSVTS